MKNQFFAIVGLCLFSLTSFAQISVTPYFQADFSNFISTPSKELKLEYDLSTQLGNEYKLNYTYGFNVNYDFTEKWSLKTGIMFQEMGSQSDKSYFLNDDEQFEAIHYELSHKFISIPIQAQYNFRAGKRFSPYIALGGALALNTSNRITTTLFDTNDEIDDVIENELLNFYGGTPRKFNISAKMDIGFNYKLTEKVSLNTFVSGNMLLNPATKSTDFSMRHFNIGAGVGLKYSF